MARMARAAGTKMIVATPHNGDVVHPPELLFELTVHFNAALRHHGIDLTVVVGAENLHNLGSDLLSHYCINDNPYLLIEFPHTHIPQKASDVVYDLVCRGLKPIIAHPERNPTILRNPELIEDFVAQGAYIQITAASLAGGSGRAVKSCSHHLLKQGLVHFMASDGHSSTRRPPVLTDGVKIATKLIGQQATKLLVDDNPRKVIFGEDL